MTTAENLLSASQILLTPHNLEKFSRAMDVPVNKIQEGLRSILPAFLIGLIKKGSSKDGAEKLVTVARKDGIEGDFSPENLRDEDHLLKGEDALQEIFGKTLSSLSSTISSTTGLNQFNTIKMMKMIAPLVLGQIKLKLPDEKMNAYSLMRFLTDQKSIFRNADEIQEFPHVNYVEKRNTLPHYTSRWKFWSLLAIITFLCVAILWWWTDRRSIPGEAIKGEVTRETSAASTATSPLPEAEELSAINSFLSLGNENDLPKHFLFTGSDAEMKLLINALLSYPSTKIRIESSDIGKAEEVKRQLVQREKIDGERIETAHSELEMEVVVTSFY